MEQEQKQSSFDQFRTGMNWFVLIVEALAFTVAVFLRRRFGHRYVGLQAAIAVPLIMVFAMLCQGYDPGPLFGFLLAYLLMCVCTGIGNSWRWWRGTQAEHSRYTGTPRVMWLLPRWNEVKVKRVVEPQIVLAVALVVINFSPPLGGYLVIAAIALFLSTHLLDLRDHKQALDMHDAVLEATWRAERFRTLNGERR